MPDLGYPKIGLIPAIFNKCDHRSDSFSVGRTEVKL